MASSTRSTGGGRKRSTPQTARPAATAREKRARQNRTAAAARRSRSPAAAHSEHPEDAADSTVRHAEPQTGKQSAGAGEGGFPQGEYDVATAGPEPKEDKRSVKEQLLDAHIGGADVRKHLAEADKKARLDRTTLTVAIETMPVGTIVEHEAENRWRVKTPTGGGFRWGHGSTFREAVESHVLGEAVVDEQSAAAKRFSELPARQQAEIRQRDEKAAARVGQRVEDSPEHIARQEAAENAKAENAALGNKKARTSATTDGPERASARDLAGQKRGAREEISSYREGGAQGSQTDAGSGSRASQARGGASRSRSGATSRSQGSTKTGSSQATGKSGGKGAASAGNNSRSGAKK